MGRRTTSEHSPTAAEVVAAEFFDDYCEPADHDELMAIWRGLGRRDGDEASAFLDALLARGIFRARHGLRVWP